jgi:hypothetical protein
MIEPRELTMGNAIGPSKKPATKMAKEDVSLKQPAKTGFNVKVQNEIVTSRNQPIMPAIKKTRRDAALSLLFSCKKMSGEKKKGDNAKDFFLSAAKHQRVK